MVRRRLCFYLWTILIPTIFAEIHPTFENPILRAKKFEGDIDGITNAPTSAPTVTVWPGGIIPFSVDGELEASTIEMLYSAISMFKKNSCVKFIPAKPNHKNSLHFKKGQLNEGCYSKIGRAGGRQMVVLELECAGVGTILHLIMHALGFYHESARLDRDNYVTIHWSNIAENNKHYFGKYIKPYEGQDYDFHSITHLPKEAFAKNRNQPTLTYKDGNPLPDYHGLSEGDLAKINYRYCQGWERTNDQQEIGTEFPNDDERGNRVRFRRSSDKKKDNRHKQTRDRRKGTAADRHHERHGHGHGAGGHGHRGQQQGK